MIRTILYVGSKYEYNNAANGDSLNKRAFYDNFKELGYEVSSIWYEGEYPDLQKEIIDAADSLRPDLIFFILQIDQVRADTLEYLKNKNFFTVNWFGDDQWRFDNFTSRYANHFSACITTHKYSIDKYREIGQAAVILSEWASLDSDIEFDRFGFQYDVSFVGGANTYRKWFVKELGKRGISVECFGNRWPKGRVNYEDMEKIFCTSKINLSISNSTQYDVRYLISNPRNILNTIRNPKNGSHVKARNFEIPVQGGFELTEYAPCLEDCFQIGREVVCYRDIDDAEVLIRYFLNHDEEREEIRRAGVLRARQQHTFKHRIKNFMAKLEAMIEQGNTVG